VEIKHDRRLRSWRHVPGDHALPIVGIEHDLFRLRQARRGRRRAKALGKILQRALRDIEQRHQPAIEGERQDQERFQRSHGL
jgi:hypothetical protein